jgi:peptidase E
LISNSTLHGSGYLDHAEQEIRDVLGSAKRVLFVPFALHDRDAYAAQARKRFEAMGYDMPIVQPPSFDSLGLVRFQINAHYLDPDPNSTHMGETREVRINQFLEENETPVVGLREGCMVRVEQGIHLLQGKTNARIFRRGLEPIEVQPGSSIDHLLG